MEKSDGAGDDQGSGWFQVKKRHRKTSVQTRVGSLSAKRSSKFVGGISRSNELTGSLHSKLRFNRQKAERSLPIPEKGAKSNEVKKGLSHPDRCLVNFNCDNSKVSFVNNPKLIHKFKWGALEDDDMVLHHQNNHAAKIMSSEIEDDKLFACRKHGNNPNTVAVFTSTTRSCFPSSPSSNIQETQLVTEKVDLGTNLSESNCKKEIVEKTSEDVNDKVSDALRLNSDNDLQIENVNEKIIKLDKEVSDCIKVQSKDLKRTTTDLVSCHLSCEDAGVVEDFRVPSKSHVEDSKIFQAPITGGFSISEASIQSTEPLVTVKYGREVSECLDVAASLGDSLRDGKENDLSDPQVGIDHEKTDPTKMNGPVISEGLSMADSVGESEDPDDGTISRELVGLLGESKTRCSGEVSQGSTMRTFDEEPLDPQDGKIHNILLVTQTMSCLGEGEVSERKDRLTNGKNEEIVDDSGSAWLQVKKKHRSKSRSLIQSSIGKVALKSSRLFSSQSPLDDKVGSSDSNHNSCLKKFGGDFPIDSQGGVANPTAFCMYEPNKYDAKEDCDSSILVNKYNSESGDSQHELLKNEPDGVHIAKCGVLEDEDTVQYYQTRVRAESKFTQIRDDDMLVVTKQSMDIHLVSLSPSSYSSSPFFSTDLQQSMMVANKEGVDMYPNSMSQMDEIAEDDNEKANDKISDIVKLGLGDNFRNQNVSKETIERKNGILDCKGTHADDVKPINDHLACSDLSGENAYTKVKFEVSDVVYVVPVADEVPSKDVMPLATDSSPSVNGGFEVSPGMTVTASIKDSGGLGDNGMPEFELLSALEQGDKAEKSGYGNSRGSTVTASVGKSGTPSDRTLHDSLLQGQVISFLGDGETAESKERFRQRLWCFLFENLNRAIDELYLLCELECDVEQMKEAILVLEEASSDFKELTTRVKEFENLKKPSYQLTDGASITLKTDHRRPHALSWEVRRMTTSPHRAEILASSLEAFRKIQEERACLHINNNVKSRVPESATHHHTSDSSLKKSVIARDTIHKAKDLGLKLKRQSVGSDLSQGSRSQSREKQNAESSKLGNLNILEDGRGLGQKSFIFETNSAGPPPKNNGASSAVGRNKIEHLGSGTEKLRSRRDRMLAENVVKHVNTTDHFKKQSPNSEKDTSWKTMDAWKEKRNWGNILSSPFHASSRLSYSPGNSRKSAERARILHDKLMSPEKKKKKAIDLKKEAEEKHARATRIRSELENERVQKLQRTSEKLNRVNEWQAVRSMKLREGMHARHQRSESRHEAYLAQVVKRAGDESSKVNEVRFITSLNEGNKKLMLRQKHHDSELRRAEKLQVIKIKQKEDTAREEAVLERKKLIEAEKLQRLAETQRRKEEALLRREEERKASSAAREARAIEQLRRKEERAKAQQEEAELLAQKLAERLSESEQRRKCYLEQIRERASMDFRDQSSPLMRRSVNKEGQGRSTPTNNVDEYLTSTISASGRAMLTTGDGTFQHSLKRRIKRIRQRLMAIKYEFPEPLADFENAGIGFRATIGTARAKISRWLQELKKLRQARKEGAGSIGLITADIIKFLEGKEAELHASRQAGLLDFIASALPASHTSRPEACQVTINLLKLLRVVLSAPANRSYFLAQNLLPPIIPMLSAALENYIKFAASLNVPGNTSIPSSKASVENFQSISEVLDGVLWTVTTIIGHISSDDRQHQMRDGLLELLIAYQVIHRLRDLFALYDRPQVEGSPFPSTILLSISLLVVLTSRSGSGASATIDCEFLTIETNDGAREAKLADPADSGYFCLVNTFEDPKPLLSFTNGDTFIPSPDVAQGRLSNESCKGNKSDKLIPAAKDSETKPNDTFVDLNCAHMTGVEVSEESQKIMILQKNEKLLNDVGVQQKNGRTSNLKPVAYLLSAISETGLVSLPSLLTSVLLQANNRLSSEQASFILPSNFEEVATGVLKVFNNLALLDIKFMQRMLARPDLKMEFFHLMSFILCHCTSKWKSAIDQVGFLLLESLLLLGYFSLFHPGNQAVLRWGKSPTILHKVCDLPFVFFSDPELMPVLAGTLIAACYGCEQNKGVVQLELSMDMLLTLLKSCRNVLPAVQSYSAQEDFQPENSHDCNHQVFEFKKSQGDIPVRSSRCNTRSTRASAGKSAASGNNCRGGKTRNPRDNKVTKASEELVMKPSLLSLEASIMLQCRLPSSFIDRAERFFSTEILDIDAEV